jgi:hypothetical protein
MSNIATTKRTSNIATMPAPQAPDSKEVIAANAQLLIEQSETGHSEGFTAYDLHQARLMLDSARREFLRNVIHLDALHEAA